MNMGTPENPEGIPHWSNTAMFAHKLEGHRRRQEAFWLFFKECCGQCEGGGFVENVLDGVTAVKREAEYGNYRPDILLERGDRKPSWLEFTHTSPPTKSKLAYCSAQGIDVFELDGSHRPLESSVRKAHISPRNCRRRLRQRLIGLWRHMESLDNPAVGIREDFRSPECQRKERQEFWREVEQRERDVSEGNLRCARCDKPFTCGPDGFFLSFMDTHKQEGGCGTVPFCGQCNFDVMGGREGVYPDDADSWGLDQECTECQLILSEHTKRMDKVSYRRVVSMPEPYGSRLVHEPERHPQEYIVGKQTVSRGEMQTVLMMFRFWLYKVLPNQPNLGLVLSEVDRILNSVQFANNIRDWDWLEGIGESYVSEDDAPDYAGGDRFLYPRRLWPEVLPCPLDFI